MSRTEDRSRRALRRRSFRRAQESWATFLRALDKERSWRPFHWVTADDAHRFVAKLASRSISWRGSDRWWKHYLRRTRKQHEAEDLRIDHDQAAAERETAACNEGS